VQLIGHQPFRKCNGPKELADRQIHPGFRFRDGLIVEHRDRCDALRWGIQALGPVKGVIAWLIPAVRRSQAMAKLQTFIDSDSTQRAAATG
jgi:hypothetical protein